MNCKCKPHVLTTASITVVWFTAIGCGVSREETAPVSGTVTLDGRPVTSGTVVFYPTDGRTAMARIGDDGQYELTTYIPGDGARLGSHKVTVESRSLRGGSASTPATAAVADDRIPLGPAGPPVVQWVVPQAYAQRATTPLVVEVRDTDNRIDLKLTTTRKR